MSAMTAAPPATGRPGTAVRRVVPLYLAGATLSLFGNAAISVALPWLVLARTGDLATTGLVATVAGVAAAPATLLGGRLADRFGARRVAVAADLGSAAAVAALGVVDGVWGLTVAWLLALGAAGALFDVPGMSARQSLLGEVARVGGARVDTVAGAFQAAFSVAFLLGPALTGLLLSVLDPVDVVWVTAACSTAAAGLTWVLPVPDPDRAAAGPGSAAGGLAVVRRDPRLRATLVITCAAALVTPPLLSVVLPGHFAELGRPGAYGLVLSLYSVGALAGSACYALLARRSRPAVYLASIVAMTGGMVVLAWLGPVPVLAVAMTVLGLGSGLYGPVWNVFVAESVPLAVRSRVIAVISAAGLVAGPVGLGVLSLVLAHASLGAGVAAIGGVWVVVGLYAVLSPGARALAVPPPGGAGGADDR